MHAEITCKADRNFGRLTSPFEAWLFDPKQRRYNALYNTLGVAQENNYHPAAIFDERALLHAFAAFPRKLSR